MFDFDAQVGKLEEAVNHGRSEFHKFNRFTEFEDLVKVDWECFILEPCALHNFHQ